MNGVDLARAAVLLYAKIHPGVSLDQRCQQFTGYYTQWAKQGNEFGIHTYESAHAAALDSVIFSTDINSPNVVPGDFAFWKIADAWHVAQVVGRDRKDRNRVLGTYATDHGDTVMVIGNHVKVSHLDSYPAVFYGYSHTDGKNPAMPLDAWDIQASTVSSDDVKVLAAYLNSRAPALGLPTTNANIDGQQGSRYWKLLQSAAHVDGSYPTSQYVIDGKPGPKTYALEVAYVAIAHAWAKPPVVVPPPVTPPPVVTPPTTTPPPVVTPPPVEPPVTPPPVDPPVVTPPPVEPPPVVVPPVKPSGKPEWLAVLAAAVVSGVLGLFAWLTGPH